MVAIELLSYVQGFSVSKYVGLEDFADRANFQGNIIVFLLSMLIVSMRQYFMNPMICYIATVPGGSNAENYITDMCWVEGTVPLNFSSKVPFKIEDWSELEKEKLNYYQWIPFVLGLQAVMFYLPRLLWQIITYNRSGMDLEQLVKDANDADSEDNETQRKIIEHISRNLEIMLYGHRNLKLRRYGKIWHHLPGKRHGNLLVSLYFFVKVLYIVIGALQLYMMYYFLRLDRKDGYSFFGYKILKDILKGREWDETQIFPRVGMCRHSFEHLGSINKVVAQCLLPINMLNEKIYIFLYFFLMAVLCLTVASLPLWIYRIFSRRTQRSLIKQCLKVNNMYQDLDSFRKSTIDRFVVEFLRYDGNFILRMLSMNVGDVVTSQIVCRLFGIYQENYFMKIDLRNIKSSESSNQFMQIPLEKVGYTKHDNNHPTAPNAKIQVLDEKVEFL